MYGKQFAMRSGFAMGLLYVAASLLVPATHAQAKAKLINGNLYRVHAGFLEVHGGAKNILLVKVNAATVYWNGRTDKKAAAKELQTGDEVVIEAVEKDGMPVA